MDKLDKLIKAMNKVQTYALFITGIGIAIVFAIEVLFRYVLKINLMGYEEVIIVVAFWLYFMGGAQGSYERIHVRANILSNFISSEKIVAAIDFFVSTLNVILLVIVAVLSIFFINNSIEIGARSTIYRFPLTIGHMAVTVGYILMAFYAVVYYIQDVYKIIKKN